MPTGEHVRYTFSAVIPRNDWREPIDGLSPTAVAREGSRLIAAISENDLRKISSIELVLDKIVPFRYIAFKVVIRYVDVPIA